MCLASAASRTVSRAASIVAARFTGATFNVIFPCRMRETSNKSSINSACSLALRSIVSRACWVFVASSRPFRSNFVQPRIGLRGDRNSRDNTPKNSSLIRLAASAWDSARRSCSHSCSPSCSACLRFVYGGMVPTRIKLAFL